MEEAMLMGLDCDRWVYRFVEAPGDGDEVITDDEVRVRWAVSIDRMKQDAVENAYWKDVLGTVDAADAIRYLRDLEARQATRKRSILVRRRFGDVEAWTS